MQVLACQPEDTFSIISTPLTEASSAGRMVPELEGRDAFITEQLELQYQTLMSRHHSRALDERAQTHLQAAGSFKSPAASAL